MIFHKALIVAFLTTASCSCAQNRVASPIEQSATRSAVADIVTQEPKSTYVIGPSDVVVVTVLKEATLSGTLLVRPDGMISIPLLGDVLASGLTPKELASDITAKLKKFIQEPNVTVVMSQINSKKVYLIGEISKVGSLDAIPGMTLVEAIASAGGLTQYANSKKIYVLRNEGEKKQRIPVRYKQALKGDSTFNIVIKPGDTIVVP